MNTPETKALRSFFFDTKENQNTKQPLPNLIKYRGDSIKDDSQLVDMIDNMECNHSGLYNALNGIAGLDEWFDAFLCSDTFAGFDTERRASIIKSKNAVSSLLTDVNYFMEANDMGVYSESK